MSRVSGNQAQRDKGEQLPTCQKQQKNILVCVPVVLPDIRSVMGFRAKIADINGAPPVRPATAQVKKKHPHSSLTRSVFLGEPPANARQGRREGGGGGSTDAAKHHDCKCRPGQATTLLLVGEGGTVVPRVAAADSAPRHPPCLRRHVSHEGFPMTLRSRGCFPPHLTWEMEYRPKGFRVTKCYTSVVHSNILPSGDKQRLFEWNMRGAPSSPSMVHVTCKS